MFALAQDSSGSPFVVCPKCAGEATHIDVVQIENAAGAVTTITCDGEDGSSSIEISSTTLRDPKTYAGRRHTITLKMYCEWCGVTSTLSLKQHKGTTFVTTT